MALMAYQKAHRVCFLVFFLVKFLAMTEISKTTLDMSPLSFVFHISLRFESHLLYSIMDRERFLISVSLSVNNDAYMKSLVFSIR